jgi:hypothetical protein
MSFPALTPWLHCREAESQFAENRTFMFPCRVNTGIIYKESKMTSRCCGDIVYIEPVHYWGQDGTLRHLGPFFLLA